MDNKEMESVLLPDVPRPIIWGRRSHLDGTAWICGRCKHENQPSCHLFVNLPAFECGKCNAKKRVEFRFSFGNLAANGTCPIGKILDQENTDDCLVYALAKTAEITARIWTILSGSDHVVPTLDPYSLKNIYTSSRLADGIRLKKINYQDKAAMEKMMELMQTIGVQDEECEHTYKIGGVERITGNFEDIVRELANGYPLIVDIMPGSEFANLMYGEIYHCPFNNRTIPDGRKKITMHTVILVGAARLENADYFYIVNSYGEWWCFRINRMTGHEIGGIGKIRAQDICNRPYKFLRCV